MAAAPASSSGDDDSVGAVLAGMRRAKRLTGAKLASMVRMSQPKISRIERGKGLVDPQDVGTIARALGADENVVRELMERAEQAQDRMTDWRPASTSLAAQQKTLQDWESASTTFRSFEPALVPGPLQTSEYAKRVFGTFQRLAPMSASDVTESSLQDAVNARFGRQGILADASKSFHFVLGESALRRRIHAPVEMLGEFALLRDVIARKPNVHLKVIPDRTLTEIPLLHGFTLLDDDLVIVDLYNTGLISRSRKDVASYRRIFDVFEERSVDIGPMLDEYEEIYIGLLRTSRETHS